MSTTYMTIHDLLRITYTYEAQALEAEAQARSRSSSQSSICSTPDLCANSSSPIPVNGRDFGALETDFTHAFAQKKRDSCIEMT